MDLVGGSVFFLLGFGGGSEVIASLLIANPTLGKTHCPC